MTKDFHDGSYVLVTTRANLAGFGSCTRYSAPVYRCIRCGRVDKRKIRASWHRKWRWLTDIGTAFVYVKGEK